MALTTTTKTGDLQVSATAGANCVLIAMSVPQEKTADLAGFAIWRKPAGGTEQTLYNRISFDQPVTSATTPAQREWTPSDQAPFQRFRWVDIPPDGVTTAVSYRVQARYFTGKGTETKAGAEASVVVQPAESTSADFRVAFTRGYVSSQAYVDRFKNAPIRPDGAKTIDFDAGPFLDQYKWLGAAARGALFDLIAECEKDTTCHVDVYAYDLDEPDFIKALLRLAKAGRLRAILDDAKLHTGDAVEALAADELIKAAGAGNVIQGHFARFQHNKVVIKRASKGGPAQKVLFGSMNFSIRGIYVQSNNIIVASDSVLPGLFAQSFDTAFSTGVKNAAFQKADIASGYKPVGTGGATPKSQIAFSPHTSASLSLGAAIKAVQAAKGSVFYAVMQPTGTGDLLGSLRLIATKPTIFSYGTVETAHGIAVQRGDGAMGDVTGFAYLNKNVPWPFSKELDPGQGMHIHDKFIVVDFNGDNPCVFTGSSNLAEGGEQANGDSLIMIQDKAIASMYAIEALKMFDHYSFRDRQKNATASAPLTLWWPGKPNAGAPWWTSYYDERNIKFRDRCLFAGVPLPPDLPTVKDADWSSLPAPVKTPKGGDTPDAERAGAPKKSASAKQKAATKTAGARAGAKKRAPAPKARAAKKAAPKKVSKRAVTKKSAKKAARKPVKKSAKRPVNTSAKKAARKIVKKPARKGVKKSRKPVAKKRRPARKS